MEDFVAHSQTQDGTAEPLGRSLYLKPAVCKWNLMESTSTTVVNGVMVLFYLKALKRPQKYAWFLKSYFLLPNKQELNYIGLSFARRQKVFKEQAILVFILAAQSES